MQTTKRSSGITLLEVLAALFVVSIGLLGVLAVIPFGAIQVSKAQHAEYASNMLANATAEVVIRNMGIESWDKVTYKKFIWCEPYPIFDSPTHIVHVPRVEDRDDWKDLMRGQDDLAYNTYDDKRPEFKFWKDGKPLSSGKYTWFFTYLLKEGEDTVIVDVLACRNRVQSDDLQVHVPKESFAAAHRGGTFTFSNGNNIVERLAQTKYVFVTWQEGSTLNGAWCKIVVLDKDERSTPRNPKIVVTGSLPSTSDYDIYVYIPSGVLYHKRVPDVPIRK